MKYRTALCMALLLVIAPACTSVNKLDLSGMSFSSTPLVGKFIWHDLMTEDIDAAKRFYGGLFGWTFEASSRSRDYSVARSGSVYVAGLVPVERPADGSNYSRWLPYVSVTNVNDAVSRSRALGAGIAASPTDVSLGRVAVIIDPEGAVLGLAKSRVGDPDDVTTAAAPGRIVWNELLANNAVAESAFYRDVVGYDVSRSDRPGGDTLLMAGGIERAAILRNPEENWEPVWLTFFGVRDPAASAERAVELGGRIVLAAAPELRHGTVAVVADPTGAILVLQKVPARTEAPQ